MSKDKPKVKTSVGAWYFGTAPNERVSITVSTEVDSRSAAYIEFELSKSEFETTYKQLKALRKQMKSKEGV